MQNLSELRVQQDLASAAFRAGENYGHWWIVQPGYPRMLFEVAATEPDGQLSRYRFMAELSGYPGQAPHVRIWDKTVDAPLALPMRPRGCLRVTTTFQMWSGDTVYRPWERMSAEHNNFRVMFPQLAWHPARTLAFILEDLHGILNLNARPSRVRSAA
jgi:hypothetical protein